MAIVTEIKEIDLKIKYEINGVEKTIKIGSRTSENSELSEAIFSIINEYENIEKIG